MKTTDPVFLEAKTTNGEYLVKKDAEMGGFQMIPGNHRLAGKQGNQPASQQPHEALEQRLAELFFGGPGGGAHPPEKLQNLPDQPT